VTARTMSIHNKGVVDCYIPEILNEGEKKRSLPEGGRSVYVYAIGASRPATHP
jgi:hypothetical protein